MPHLITDDNLGAWLIKCRPDASPGLPDVVTHRCVADNYRSRMMKPGDKAILWVSGNGRRMTRGIWGVGWVTGCVRHTPGSDRDIALDIPLFDSSTALAAAELVAAGVDDLEVQTQAQMSNPSWVSKEQLARIEALLEPWPEYT